MVAGVRDFAVSSFVAAKRQRTRIDQVLRQLRLPRKLSRRERQVAAGCALGLDTKATAAELGLSPKTVDEFWRRVYRKLNCHSRIEVLSIILSQVLTQRSAATHQTERLVKRSHGPNHDR